MFKAIILYVVLGAIIAAPVVEVRENTADTLFNISTDLDPSDVDILAYSIGLGIKRDVQENIIDDAIAVAKEIEALIKQALGGGKIEVQADVLDAILKVSVSLKPTIEALIKGETRKREI